MLLHLQLQAHALLSPARDGTRVRSDGRPCMVQGARLEDARRTSGPACPSDVSRLGKGQSAVQTGFLRVKGGAFHA